MGGEMGLILFFPTLKGICTERVKNRGDLSVFHVEKTVILFSIVLYCPFSPVFLFFRGIYDTLLYYNGFFPTWIVLWKK